MIITIITSDQYAIARQHFLAQHQHLYILCLLDLARNVPTTFASQLSIRHFEQAKNRMSSANHRISNLPILLFYTIIVNKADFIHGNKQNLKVHLVDWILQQVNTYCPTKTPGQPSRRHLRVFCNHALLTQTSNIKQTGDICISRRKGTQYKQVIK